MNEEFNIWEGTYESFFDVPVCGNGFESDKWINDTYNKTVESYDDIKNNKRYDVKFNISPLYITSSIISSDETLKILDFGGGMGISFIELISVLPDNKNISFTVIEGKGVCEKASIIYENDNRIRFCTQLPTNELYDVIHISSSLQYVENWKGLLKELSKYDAKYFIFNDLPAGDIEKTYATIQNYYDSKIPYWFFQLDDVIEEMNINGYKLSFQANYKHNILGKFEYFPQDNFENKLQIGYSKNLIFRRF